MIQNTKGINGFRRNPAILWLRRGEVGAGETRDKLLRKRWENCQNLDHDDHHCYCHLDNLLFDKCLWFSYLFKVSETNHKYDVSTQCVAMLQELLATGKNRLMMKIVEVLAIRCKRDIPLDKIS